MAKACRSNNSNTRRPKLDESLQNGAMTQMPRSKSRRDCDSTGFDETVVVAEVFFLAQKSFAMFDDLTHVAQGRHMTLLREISIRCEFAKRATRSSDTVIDAKYERASKPV
jgi:hypothetical protein